MNNSVPGQNNSGGLPPLPPPGAVSSGLNRNRRKTPLSSNNRENRRGFSGEQEKNKSLPPSSSLAKIVRVKEESPAPDRITDPDVPTMISPSHKEKTSSDKNTPRKSSTSPASSTEVSSSEVSSPQKGAYSAPESSLSDQESEDEYKPVKGDSTRQSGSESVSAGDQKSPDVAGGSTSTGNNKEQNPSDHVVEEEKTGTARNKVSDNREDDVPETTYLPVVKENAEDKEKPDQQDDQDNQDNKESGNQGKGKSNWISGKSITPQIISEKKKKKRSIFWVFYIVVFSILMSVGTVLGAWGYTMWVDAEADKRANQAYEDGARDIVGDPSFESVVRMEDDDFDTLVREHPGKDIPEGYRVDDRVLIGWSVPGGTEHEGRANVEICWTAEDIDGHRSSRVYMVSEDAQDREPTWIIDTVTNTNEKCFPGEEDSPITEEEE